jgi:hypothetical protein
VGRVLAIAAGLLLGAWTAGADSIRYSWTGFVEPKAGENPWDLAGDGSAVTNGDGTPFLIEAFLDVDSLDEDGTQNPDYAEFAPVRAALIIGGDAAVLDSPSMNFSDDAFDGLFDSVGFAVNAERLGTTLYFAADVRLPATSFDLASPAAADPPPTFPEHAPIQLGGFGLTNLVTMPADAPVTATVVPWITFPAASVVEWDTATTGSADHVGVVMTGLADPAPTLVDLSIPAFAAAPSFALVSGLDYAAGSSWTVDFSEPVASLLIYPRFWRGSNGSGPDPITYHFDVPFSIRSGLADASIVGNLGGLILSLPGGAFHDGVVQVPGPLTSLTVTPNTATGSLQTLAMAVVPMPSARPVVWTTPNSGTAGGVTVTLAELGATASLQRADLSGPDFAVAPLAASAPVVEYDTGADWTATFSEPVEGVLLYAKAWRGSDAAADPVTYRFDAPFTILSGLDAAAVSEDGTLLTLPAAEFHDGIVYVPGPLTSLAVTGNEPSDVAQVMTLAVVPEPGSAGAGLAAAGALLALGVRPRRRVRACGAPAPRSSAPGSAGCERTPS